MMKLRFLTTAIFLMIVIEGSAIIDPGNGISNGSASKLNKTLNRVIPFRMAVTRFVSGIKAG